MAGVGVKCPLVHLQVHCIGDLPCETRDVNADVLTSDYFKLSSKLCEQYIWWDKYNNDKYHVEHCKTIVLISNLTATNSVFYTICRYCR